MDKLTRFKFKILSLHFTRMKNGIKDFNINKEWVEESNKVKEKIKWFFMDWYEEKEKSILNLDGINGLIEEFT